MSTLQHGPLHADLYAYTMALALFRAGTHNTHVTFHSFIRRTPFGGSFALVAGLADVMKWLEDWKFSDSRVDYLRSLKTAAGNPLFDEAFLKMVAETPLTVTIDALPEGALAFANVPFLRISGPIWQCLVVEAIILNIINAQSLIATEAARCVIAATGFDGTSLPIMDGSLRRALDIGGRAPARASFIGGFVGTSNVAAAMDLGIPTRGTFAHAFVVFHDTEEEAFRTYVRHMEDITILLDTYNTLAAIHLAIRVCKEEGKKLRAVRLDSGALAYLSKECRIALNAAGMNDTLIMASNDLNPRAISTLMSQMARGEASIQMLMVGTDVGAPSEQSSIGGVYKLMDVNGRPVIKVAERGSKGADQKTTIPGPLGTLRFLKEHQNVTQFDSDTILSLTLQHELAGLTAANDDPDKVYHLPRALVSVNMADPDRPKQFAKGYAFTIPHIRVVENGVILGTHETSLQTIQKYAKRNLSMLDRSHLELDPKYFYVAGIEDRLYELRRSMIREIHLASQSSLEEAAQVVDAA